MGNKQVCVTSLHLLEEQCILCMCFVDYEVVQAHIYPAISSQSNMQSRQDTLLLSPPEVTLLQFLLETTSSLQGDTNKEGVRYSLRDVVKTAIKYIGLLTLNKGVCKHFYNQTGTWQGHTCTHINHHLLQCEIHNHTQTGSYADMSTWSKQAAAQRLDDVTVQASYETKDRTICTEIL